MTFTFIAKHRTAWPVAWMCAALNVSRSGPPLAHSIPQPACPRRRGDPDQGAHELRGQRPHLRRASGLA